MSDKIRISTAPEQLQEGLFGQVFLWVFEILPYLDCQGIFPAWAIRSTLYGAPEDFVVIPGLLEVNYDAGAENFQDVNLQDLRDRHVVTLGNDWDYAAQLWRKYFRWPARVSWRADEFPPLSQALGIHYRGTDKNKSLVETNYVSPEDFLALVRDFVATHPDIGTIYVASDENAFVEKVRAQHSSLRIFNSGEVTHHKDKAIENNFSKGDHALLDCLLLSRCKYLLKCQSALSGFAKILNPRLEAYRVSANKLAPWCFGNPYFPDAFLPKLTSQNPECQKILAGLLAGDWTQDRKAGKKFGGVFRYKTRKESMRKDRGVPKWSWDGLHLRLDSRLARLARKLGG
ncbi:MAG: hypothetical protein ABSC01_08610 [Verrucomicrobiota bacterium]|jgi:hypothetical protein